MLCDVMRDYYLILIIKKKKSYIYGLKNHLIKSLFGNFFFITNSTWLGITRNLPERNKKFLKWKGIGFFRKSLSPQMKFRWLELFQCIWKVCDKKKKGKKKVRKDKTIGSFFFFRERFKLCTRLINRCDTGKNNCFNHLIYKILIDFFSLDLLTLFLCILFFTKRNVQNIKKYNKIIKFFYTNTSCKKSISFEKN